MSRRPQQLSAHVIARDVVAGRQASFLETDGPIRLGERLTTEPDLDVHVSRNDRDLVSSSHTTGNRPKVRTIPAWAMASPDKKPPRQDPRSRSRTPRTPGTRSSTGRSKGDSASVAERALIGDIRLEADRAFSAARRLRARGLNVFSEAALPEKEKVSITLDKPLVDEIRGQFGGRALSTSMNELLYAALAQERLGQLVDEMQEEAGAASPEAYERVLAQWFAEG